MKYKYLYREVDKYPRNNRIICWSYYAWKEMKYKYLYTEVEKYPRNDIITYLS